MKYGVSRKVLLFTAGVVWIVAGANILRIGLITWRESHGMWAFRIAAATVVFALFFGLVFRRLYRKHSRRIGRKADTGNCPFGFFDAKGWIVMCVMIAAGVCIRTFELLPNTFIAIFYTGLSLALLLTGLLFLSRAWQRCGNDAP